MRKNNLSFVLSYIGILFFLFVGCKKEQDTKVYETGSLVDIDNNSYKTIKIGNQWWMAEDLKTTRYKNGVMINSISVSDNINWAQDTSGSKTTNINNANEEGFLYNWFSVHSGNNLAPDGWHIPTDQDWKILEQFLGMSNMQSDKTGWRGILEGDKLKITGEDYWHTYGTVWATNEFNFSALASGCRLHDGSWSTPFGNVYMGFWWTSSENNNNVNEGWYRYLDYKRSQIFRSHLQKTYGLSVRCVKD